MQSEYDYFNLSFVVRLSFPALSISVFVILYCYYYSRVSILK